VTSTLIKKKLAGKIVSRLWLEGAHSGYAAEGDVGMTGPAGSPARTANRADRIETMAECGAGRSDPAESVGAGCHYRGIF